MPEREKKVSKYNLLNEEEKLFVELVVFGDYSAEQAAMTIRGENYHKGQGNRMCARPNVADALEELSYKKNKKFMAEVTSSRDAALRKLMYIMNTTEDEGVAAACAKTILDKADKVIINNYYRNNGNIYVEFLDIEKETMKRMEEELAIQNDYDFIFDNRYSDEEKFCMYVNKKEGYDLINVEKLRQILEE